MPDLPRVWPGLLSRRRGPVLDLARSRPPTLGRRSAGLRRRPVRVGQDDARRGDRRARADGPGGAHGRPLSTAGTACRTVDAQLGGAAAAARRRASRAATDATTGTPGAYAETVTVPPAPAARARGRRLRARSTVADLVTVLVWVEAPHDVRMSARARARRRGLRAVLGGLGRRRAGTLLRAPDPRARRPGPHDLGRPAYGRGIVRGSSRPTAIRRPARGAARDRRGASPAAGAPTPAQATDAVADPRAAPRRPRACTLAPEDVVPSPQLPRDDRPRGATGSARRRTRAQDAEPACARAGLDVPVRRGRRRRTTPDGGTEFAWAACTGTAAEVAEPELGACRERSRPGAALPEVRPDAAPRSSAPRWLVV